MTAAHEMCSTNGSYQTCGHLIRLQTWTTPKPTVDSTEQLSTLLHYREMVLNGEMLLEVIVNPNRERVRSGSVVPHLLYCTVRMLYVTVGHHTYNSFVGTLYNNMVLRYPLPVLDERLNAII